MLEGTDIFAASQPSGRETRALRAASSVRTRDRAVAHTEVVDTKEAP
jgi:hypothetical protein